MNGNERRRKPDAMSAIFIDTTRTKKVFDRLDELMKRSADEAICCALPILGLSGAGKTRGCKEWVRRRQQAAKETGGRFDAVWVEIPADCSLKGLAAEILMALGDPDPDYGSQTDRTRRIAELVAAQKLHLLVLDELQRFIGADSGRVKREVANWLTGLINRDVCPLVLIGEPQAELVFEGNTYLERRTLGAWTVEPYDWHDGHDRTEFRTWLHLTEQELGLAEPSGLAEPDLAIRIHAFSLGRIGLAVRLLTEARSLARMENRTRLTRALLGDAADLLRIGSAKRKPNPFRVANPVAADPPPEVRDEEPTPPRRGRPRKEAE